MKALIALLKRTIDEARFPYSPHLAPLKAILAKLVPPVPRRSMIGSEPASVFEDREISGDWRVEKFDEVQVFTGPDARGRAIEYAKERYGAYVVHRGRYGSSR